MKKTIYVVHGMGNHAYESQAKAFQAFKSMVMNRLEKIDSFNPIDYLDDYRTPLWRVWEIQYTSINGREYYIQPMFWKQRTNIMVNKASMTKEEIMKTVEALAHSQGYYSRLYGILKANHEALEFLEKQNFKKPIDIIMFLEN